jgi:hypothetical protein
MCWATLIISDLVFPAFGDKIFREILFEVTLDRLTF